MGQQRVQRNAKDLEKSMTTSGHSSSSSFPTLRPANFFSGDGMRSCWAFELSVKPPGERLTREKVENWDFIIGLRRRVKAGETNQLWDEAFGWGNWILHRGCRCWVEKSFHPIDFDSAWKLLFELLLFRQMLGNLSLKSDNGGSHNARDCSPWQRLPHLKFSLILTFCCLLDTFKLGWW